MTPDWCSPCGLAEIYHGDAIGVMSSTSSSFNAIITAPPYAGGWFGCMGQFADLARQMTGSVILHAPISNARWICGRLFKDPLVWDGIDLVVVTDPPTPGNQEHPAPTPPQMATRWVSMVCKRGDRVLDPYAGSGGIGVACLRLGVRYVGIEREREYVDAAINNITPGD